MCLNCKTEENSSPMTTDRLSGGSTAGKFIVINTSRGEGGRGEGNRYVSNRRRESGAALTTWENLGGPVLSEEFLMTLPSPHLQQTTTTQVGYCTVHIQQFGLHTHIHTYHNTVYQHTRTKHSTTLPCFLIWTLWSPISVKQNFTKHNLGKSSSFAATTRWNRTPTYPWKPFGIKI